MAVSTIKKQGISPISILGWGKYGKLNRELNLTQNAHNFNYILVRCGWDSTEAGITYTRIPVMNWVAGGNFYVESLRSGYNSVHYFVLQIISDTQLKIVNTNYDDANESDATCIRDIYGEI